MKNVFVVFEVAWLAFTFVSEGRSEDVRGIRFNQNVIDLLPSVPGLTGNVLEIANAMDHTDGMRVSPIIGRGSLQSINGLLFLRGVDMAQLSSKSLAFVKRNNLTKTGLASLLISLSLQS